MSLAASRPAISRQDAAKELLRRREARREMMPFVQYVKPLYNAQWYHRAICRNLDKFVGGEFKKLMLFVPPQHGKSELVSRMLPAYVLGCYPDARVVGASYAAELIESMNRDVQRVVEAAEYQRLFPATTLNSKNIRTVAGNPLRNNDCFEVVGRNGSYRCAGVGGSLTGFPCDYGIIDDPFKDYKEATSARIRQTVWEWYTSVFLTRTHVNTRILLTLTRWHEDDLAARLLAQEGTVEEGGLWKVFKLPAICENPDAPDEERELGEALWPERFPVETLEERRALNAHQFEALYQQNPTPREGAFFKVSQLEIVDVLPAGMREVRAWDIAASEGRGDFSVGVKLGTRGDGFYYVTDVVRGQWSSDDRDRVIKQTAQLDGAGVRVLLPQDPGAAGKSLAQHFIRLLAGFPVTVSPVSGDKETRANPASSQVGGGNIKMLKAVWNSALVEEMRQFPQGVNDDQVDALSDAFNEVARSGSFFFL